MIGARDFSSVPSLCLKTRLSHPALLACCDLRRCLQCLKKEQLGTAKGLNVKMSVYVVMRISVKPKLIIFLKTSFKPRLNVLILFLASTIPGGPKGGQTRVYLRNEHLQYIITWYVSRWYF